MYIFKEAISVIVQKNGDHCEDQPKSYFGKAF